VALIGEPGLDSDFAEAEVFRGEQALGRFDQQVEDVLSYSPDYNPIEHLWRDVKAGHTMRILRPLKR
jgi:hypothetical protein